MDKLNMGKHISNKFNEELEAVRNRVLSMGGLVEQQLSDALTAIQTADVELAEKVLTNDHKINKLEVQIDEECVHIIAKRQPAASDLRLVIAIIKTIADLERIGDEAERIAKVAKESFSNDQQQLLVSLENLGHQILIMLRKVLDAFARMDLDSAYEVHRQDEQADRQYEALTRQLMTYMMEDSRSIPKIMNVLWSARSLERMGDRCQNIAEYIIFFVKGKDVRHVSPESIERTVKGDRTS
ncbi:PhoU-like phosphate uptake regulator [Idiomarina fontislapidosi]|uniref:Phosphate-specific transport system accessory protein PhoU n=1 Tax=Idiomarina fontislapidosi TaxID=263723 RepID=A0A432Y8H0_9GAMM|nr:phosphate signaling complex protein PhoU [Idiomarina fontislapidosi]PYE33888.1 PhoU-like phosphate uptake regulator [Idiomarina fontislapidosi]RUO57275.1 phosphate transport system regulatory protein PhoU [Idiomarina fontislapidosi]|tara:strand:- start:3663 stop:4385 length:723 start_codon:yes stop_codon:yes gene_type:complete